MDLGKLVYDRLIQDSTITGYVNTRVFPGFVPQDEQFPAIVYSMGSQLPTKTKDGASKLDVIDLEIVIYHESETGAQAIADRIRTLLDYYSGTSQGVTVDNITFDNQTNNSYVVEYEFAVLTQSYNARMRR